MGKKQSRTFAIKFGGEYFKILRITRTQDCLVFVTPVVPIHITIPKDGRIHDTVDDPNLKIFSTRNNRIRGKQRDYFNEEFPAFRELTEPILVETSYCFAEIGKLNIPPRYEIIDLDFIKCVGSPEIRTYISPPNEESANKLNIPFISERRILKFPDVWVILVVGSPSQKY